MIILWGMLLLYLNKLLAKLLDKLHYYEKNRRIKYLFDVVYYFYIVISFSIIIFRYLSQFS